MKCIVIADIGHNRDILMVFDGENNENHFGPCAGRTGKISHGRATNAAETGFNGIFFKHVVVSMWLS